MKQIKKVNYIFISNNGHRLILIKKNSREMLIATFLQHESYKNMNSFNFEILISITLVEFRYAHILL